MKSVYRVWALLALISFSSARKILDFPDGEQQQKLEPSLAPNRPSIDPNLVLILAALLCALFFGLGLNLMIRCALCLTSILRVPAMAARGRVTGADHVTLGYSAGRPNSGLKKAEVDALPAAPYSAADGAAIECVICLREFVDGEIIRVLPKCAHCFHLECIDRWLVSNSLCPICRAHMAEALDKKPPANGVCTNCGRNAADESTAQDASQNVGVQSAPSDKASCSGTGSNLVDGSIS